MAAARILLARRCLPSLRNLGCGEFERPWWAWPLRASTVREQSCLPRSVWASACIARTPCCRFQPPWQKGQVPQVAGPRGGRITEQGLRVLPPRAPAGTDPSPGSTSDPERSLGFPCWPGKTPSGPWGGGGAFHGWSRGAGRAWGWFVPFISFLFKKIPWHVFIYFVIKVK